MLATFLCASIAAFGAAPGGGPHGLRLGDPAPSWRSRSPRGEPVKKFEPGKTYVVAFLEAPGMGRPGGGLDAYTARAIVYLTALQRTYKDVIFLGMTTDGDAKAVAFRVAERVGKLDFRVAVEGASDELGGKMECVWAPGSGTLAA